MNQPAGEGSEVRPQSEHDLRVIVGHNFREARRRSGLTQTEVAEQIGSAATYIGTIERGDANISLGMLARLASVVGVAPKVLIHEASQGDDTPGSFHQLASALQESICLQRAVLTASTASCETMETAIKTILETMRKPSQVMGVIKKLGQHQRTPKR